MKEHAHDSPEVVQLAAFCIDSEEYVIDIMRVREIIRPLPITPIRRGPQFVEGVLNLRGTVVPIIDLRRRFGLEPKESRLRRIIIMVVDGRILGLIVDRMSDVVRVERSSIRPAPGCSMGNALRIFWVFATTVSAL